MNINYSTSIRFAFVSIFIWLTLQSIYFSTIQRYELKNVVSKGTHWPDMFPAGEIVSNFKLRQNITAEQTDIQSNKFHNNVCLEIQLATYGNRLNKGTFEVRITTKDASETKVLDAKLIEDNALEVICFDHITFEQIYKKEAWLEISGTNGQPKQSVTAMLSSFPGGHRAEVQGKPTSSTLVYQASIQEDSKIYKINAHVLIVFTSLIIALMLFSWRPINQA